MIIKPTVFVLGAGASYNFGYPLGKGLVEIILNNFDPKNLNNAIKLFMGLGFSENEIASFSKELRLSSAPSIDSFLEHRDEDEKYLGKLSIAYALIPFEDEEKLIDRNSWYVTFLNIFQSSLNDFEKNKVSFITFNYDRSLEHFLMIALQNRLKKSEKEIAEKLSKIPIIHLYGKLGFLPWEKEAGNKDTREYNSEVFPHLLRRSTKTLKIIYEKVPDDNPEFKQARILLRNARRIFFLGFGYHSENLDRLKLKSVLQPISSTVDPTTTISKLVIGTSYGLSQESKENIPKNYRIQFPNHDWDINELFEQKIRFD